MGLLFVHSHLFCLFAPFLGLSNKHNGKRSHISFALALWRFISFLLYPSTYYLFFLDYLFVWKRIKTKRKKLSFLGGPPILLCGTHTFGGTIWILSVFPRVIHLSRFCGTLFSGGTTRVIYSLSHVFFSLPFFFPPPRVCPSCPSIC